MRRSLYRDVANEKEFRVPLLSPGVTSQTLGASPEVLRMDRLWVITVRPSRSTSNHVRFLAKICRISRILLHDICTVKHISGQKGVAV